jgi:cell division protein FtsN
MWVGILIGLLVGLCIALGVALYINKGANPFVQQKQKAAEKAAEKSTEPQKEAPGTENSRSGTSAADKHSRNAEGKPRFDFYKILPGTEEAVTDKEFKRAAPAATKEVYFLQVAAFQSPSDADNLKARLALAGIEAQIQTATLPDGQVWHRVRVGPFLNQDELGKSRDALKQNRMEANLIKVRE